MWQSFQEDRLFYPKGPTCGVITTSSTGPPDGAIFDKGGGNSNIFYFHPELWGRFPNLTHIFQMGWLKPPTSYL